MLGKERPYGEWGFAIVDPGYYRITWTSPIQKKEKESSVTLEVPFKIDDDSSNNGTLRTLYIPWGTPFGEQKIADILVAVKMYKQFADKFPGDVSAFDPKFLAAFAKAIPGKPSVMKFAISKDGKFNEFPSVYSEDYAKANGIDYSTASSGKRVPVADSAEPGPSESVSDDDAWLK